MPFDYKKEYKEFYLPPQKPQLLEVPPMNYVAVRGHGDPNAQDGEYQAAIGGSITPIRKHSLGSP